MLPHNASKFHFYLCQSKFAYLTKRIFFEVRLCHVSKANLVKFEFKTIFNVAVETI